MGTVIISPHLDDAVLSCWHLLTGPGDVLVVTVFCGIPSPGTLGVWDGLTGASDSAERMGERLEEDAEALAAAGVGTVRLDLLDEQYRRNGDVPAVADALADHTRGADAVYAPLGLFLSGDHRIVRDAARQLREDLCLYADHPHAALWGLPSWVTGEVRPGELDVAAAWRLGLLEAGFDPNSLRPTVYPLDATAFGRKLAALRSYRTQLPALEREAPLDQLRWEVTWTL